MPAVVNIATERIVRRQVPDTVDDFFSAFFDEPANRAPREVAQKIQSLGSGFLIDGDGDIVTNEHVVERAADLKIQVTLQDGTTLPARYVAGDARADLALLKVERPDRKKPFAYISLADPSPNLLGQTVLALGNPLGYNSSVSRGILSANDREITIDRNTYRHLVQTDAAINPGNSGGPLIDLAGRLCGVNSVKLALTPQGQPAQGLGFAIPARTVATKIDEFRGAAARLASAPSVAGTTTLPRRAPAPGSAPPDADDRGAVEPAARGGSPTARRLFGLQLQTLTPELANALGVRAASGVVITDVDDDSAAAEAGLQRGMVIYRVGPYVADSTSKIEALFRDLRVGSTVDFVVGVNRGVGRNRNLATQLGKVTLIARGE
jgi:serine protease Do